MRKVGGGGGRRSTNDCLRLHIYLLTNKTLIDNFLYVFDIWLGNFKP